MCWLYAGLRGPADPTQAYVKARRGSLAESRAAVAARRLKRRSAAARSACPAVGRSHACWGTAAVYPVIFIDAILVKVRDGQVANKPVYVVIGVTVDGERDILGLWAGDGGEGAKFWLGVVTEIKNRGVQDVCIAICDGPEGASRGNHEDQGSRDRPSLRDPSDQRSLPALRQSQGALPKRHSRPEVPLPPHQSPRPNLARQNTLDNEMEARAERIRDSLPRENQLTTKPLPPLIGHSPPRRASPREATVDKA